MIGFWGLLQIILITLKLLGVITCSWWLLFLPQLIGLGLVVLALSLVGMAGLANVKK